MSHIAFIIENRDKLASAMREALSSNMLGSVRSVAESILDDWELVRDKAPTLLADGERELWCAVWTAQHLGDAEHWRDGVAQKDFLLLLRVLEGTSPLPQGWIGNRP